MRSHLFTRPTPPIAQWVVVCRAAIVCLGLLLPAIPALGQLPQAADPDLLVPISSDVEYLPRAVLILPLSDFTTTASELFSEAPQEQSEVSARISSLLGSLVDNDPRLRQITVDAYRRKLDKTLKLEAGLRLLRERFELGRALYDELRVDAAADLLGGAETASREIFADVIEPKLVGDVYLTLGLAQLERGRPELAHIAFKRMFQVHPQRRFVPGYYPTNAEDAFRAALTDLSATSTGESAYADAVRLDSFLAAAGADDAVLTSLIAGPQGPKLRIVVYGRQTRSFLFREDVDLGDLDAIAENVERAASRWFACIPVALDVEGGRTSGPSGHFGRGLVDSAGVYGIYFGFPTREHFHNVGFTFNGAWNVRPQLDLFVKVSLLTAFADPRQDLQSGSLTSVRTVLGAGVAFEKGIWRPFIRPGIELHYVSPFTVITNPACKFWGIDDPRCPTGRSAWREVDSALLGGVNLATGFALAAGRGVYFTMQANFSLYFSLLEQTNLNYLLSGEVGLGYSF